MAKDGKRAIEIVIEEEYGPEAAQLLACYLRIPDRIIRSHLLRLAKNLAGDALSNTKELTTVLRG